LAKKPRGLFLIHLPPPTHGVSVINSWIQESEEIKNFVNIDSVDLATASTISDIGKQSIGKYYKFIKILFLTLNKLLWKHYDFVYITLSPIGSAFIKDSILVLLTKFFSIPIIVHLHGKGISKSINSSKWLLNYYNFVFKNVYVIHLANSLALDLSLIKSYKKLFIVPNGVPPVTFTNKVNSDIISILHLSNLIETKGSFILLKSIKELVSQGIRNIEVKFVGDWGDQNYKERFIDYVKKHDLTNYVNIPGPLYNEDKLNILAQADIFVLPTYYANECFPLTILEAFQAGLPVISSFEGAIPEIITDGVNGFVINAKNELELAKKLEVLISSSMLRIELGNNARETYSKKYEFSIFEKNLIEIFDEVVKKR
jgi:glycosyltransferase involved in cell wall biosynthesis